MNYYKLVFASLIASGALVACSDEISENSVDVPYAVNTSNLKSAGQAVDLGLPSGTKWADKNVGAANATDNGILFIWGDVTGTQSLAKTNTYEACAVTSADLYNRFKGSEQIAHTYDSLQVYNDSYTVLNNDSVEVIYNGVQTILESLKSKYTGTLEATITATATNGDELTVLTTTEKVLDSNNYRDYATRVSDQATNYAKALENQANALNTLNQKKELLEKVKKETPGDAAAIERKQKAVDKAQAAYDSAVKDVAYWNTYVTDQKLFFNSYSVVINEIKATDVKFYQAAAVGDNDYKEYKYPFKEAVYDKEYLGHDYNNIASNDLIGNASYDAATANWGAGWQMPTKEQLQELVEKCTWEFKDNGYTVTGPNGNSIFLPADGYRYGGNQIGKGTAGYYVSGSILASYHFPSTAEQVEGGLGTISAAESMPNMLVFQHGDYDNSVKVLNNITTIYGVSIRPVAK